MDEPLLTISTPDAEGTRVPTVEPPPEVDSAAPPAGEATGPFDAPAPPSDCDVALDEPGGARRPVSLWLAWLPGLLMPHRLAARTAHLPLRRLVIFHVLSTSALVVTLLLASEVVDHGYRPAQNVFMSVLLDGREIFRSVATDRWGWLALLVCVAGCEAIVAAIALVIAAWGARDEPWRRSFGNAIRAVWVALPAAIPFILAPTLVSHELQRRASGRDAYSAYAGMTWPAPPNPPTVPPTLPASMPAWNEYRQAYDRFLSEQREAQLEYERRYATWRNETPWLLRHHEEMTAASFFLLGALFIVQLLRTVAAPRRTPTIVRPGMCENCGYNLATIPMESRCPECGTPVLASLGDDVRPGSPWEHRAQLGRPRAWAKSCFMPILRPGRFGRLIRATVRPTGLLPFLTLHAAAIVPIAALSVLCTVLWLAPGNIAEDDRAQIATVGVCFGLACGALAVLASTFMAHVVGVILGLRAGRNLIPAAMQVGTYLMGYVVLWATVGAAWTSCTIAMLTKEVFRDFARSLGDMRTYGELYALIFWATPNVAAFVLYVSLLVRGTSAAKYANR